MINDRIVRRTDLWPARLVVVTITCIFLIVIAKRVEYTDHARRRLRSRQITRREVRWLLARGIKARSRSDSRQMTARGHLGRHEAVLWYEENAERYLIRTVLWVETDAEQKRQKGWRTDR